MGVGEGLTDPEPCQQEMEPFKAKKKIIRSSNKNKNKTNKIRQTPAPPSFRFTD